ncbi:hypothetical protein CONLIGDRAFT_629205 [Coniochaeta ligniaria NRRL 30616]|uniref:Uncharacterized protein n=1 Tax=Coniochaeta ligniaria NRRL 30616 TaxID=1408157 RepID=A0A1J7JNR6_9PEZI|nr:hypothetical protein CONLIGDRAFT_629205 [Coniochaeta ligniaria NRRL 30616]
MKSQGSLLVLAAAVRLATADCNANNCLRAVIGSAFTTRNGAQDCSSLLVVTVTPATSTVTSTVTVLPTVYTTIVGTELSTTTESNTVSTQTADFTTQQTQTASTETDFTTITVTAAAATLKRRAVTKTCPTPPAYASPCSSWPKYVSACSCVGVVPTTVTATPETTACTSTVTSSIFSTISSIETDVISVTASTSATETQLISVIDTTLATVTQTAIPSSSPVSVCGPASGPFKAHATQYAGNDYYIYANLLNGLTGGVTWNALSASTAASVQNKYIWTIDANGHLGLAYNVPPYTYQYVVYMSTASSGSNWPQLGTQASVAASVAAGAAVTYVNACVDSITGELKLDAAGRTQIMYCGQQLWMSSTLGSDVNRGTCVQMFPTIVLV